MPRKKEKFAVKGSLLVATGDIVYLRDDDSVVKCRVLSCVLGKGGVCHASLEILEGERQGQCIAATMRPEENAPAR